MTAHSASAWNWGGTDMTPRRAAPDLSPAEAAKVAEFDAAPVPPECDASGVNVVAEALCTESFGAEFLDEQTPEWQEYLRRLAAAAIAALPPSPAEEAVKRVEALAEEFDSATLPPLINDFDRGLVAGYARAAARIRAALDPS